MPWAPRNASLRARRLLVSSALLLWAIMGAVAAIQVWNRDSYSDFDVYHRMATEAIRGGWDRIYGVPARSRDEAGAGGSRGGRAAGKRESAPVRLSPFRYSPAAIPLLAPFGLLPHRVARELWFCLQLACLSAGFLLLSGALRDWLQPGRRRLAPGIAALACLFTLRYCFDALTIGQVSGLIFLCYAIAIRAVSRRGWWSEPRASGKAWLAGAALALPALLKLGPAFIFLAFAPLGWRALASALGGGSSAVAALGLASCALSGWDRAGELWRSWWEVVLADGAYFDSAHYASQSIKSALLRAARVGLLPPERVEGIWLTAVALLAGALAVFWLRARARAPRTAALSVALGILAQLWLMPQTFKYSLTALAFPLALVMSGGRSALAILALSSTAAFASLAGLDLIGYAAFMRVQEWSLPLLATLFVGWAVAREAARRTRGQERLARAGERSDPNAPGAAAIHADDWGLSPATNAAILAAARAGRIQRVSLMAGSPWLDLGLADLLATGVRPGIHFHLTHSFPGQPAVARGPVSFLARWLFARSRIDRQVITELRCQLERLRSLGVAPAFFDSHHHVHLAPGLLRAIAPRLGQAGIREVRVPLDTTLLVGWRFPIPILAWLLAREARKLGFSFRPFAYPCGKGATDPARLNELARARPGAEILVHLRPSG